MRRPERRRPALIAALLGSCALSAAAQEQTIEGALEEGDAQSLPAAFEDDYASHLRDVFTVESEGEQAVTIDVRAEFDCLLVLLDPQGEIAAINDDFDVNIHSRLEDTRLSEAGTYQVVVTSYSPAITGTYTLVLGEPGEPPAPDPDEPLAAGVPVQAELRAGDDAALPEEHERASPDHFRDGWVLEAAAGDRLVIESTADFDTYLILVDPLGEIVAENDDHVTMFDSRLEFDVQADGLHRIVVTSYRRETTGDYTLALVALSAP